MRNRMKGSFHVIGPAHLVAKTFETFPPRPNPPPETYYRRMLYAIGLQRIAEILKALDARDSGVGKVRRNEQGDAIGRGRSSLDLSRWPEVPNMPPARLAKHLRAAKSAVYFETLQEAIQNAEEEMGDAIAAYIAAAPKKELDALPPVIYPAHRGNARCEHCRAPHPAALHRFHFSDSFKRTHPGIGEERKRESKRADLKRRLKEEIPF